MRVQQRIVHVFALALRSRVRRVESWALHRIGLPVVEFGVRCVNEIAEITSSKLDT